MNNKETNRLKKRKQNHQKLDLVFVEEKDVFLLVFLALVVMGIASERWSCASSQDLSEG
jgi:hypothetical protein